MAIGNRLRLFWGATRTVTARDVDAELDRLKDSMGWMPGIIVIDYADILAPESGSGRDFRHQENARWEALRRLSQDWECCVVTATQSTRETYRKRLISEGDASEDKRKAAHVTAMFGLNKDAHDRRRGWMRINPVFVRDDDYDPFDQVAVLQLLQRGMPNLGSWWWMKKSEE